MVCAHSGGLGSCWGLDSWVSRSSGGRLLVVDWLRIRKPGVCA